MNLTNPVAKVSTERTFTIELEGFEPITGLRKTSQWLGMWELRGPNGSLVVLAPDPVPGGFLGFMPQNDALSGRVVQISPALLVAQRPHAVKEVAAAAAAVAGSSPEGTP